MNGSIRTFVGVTLAASTLTVAGLFPPAASADVIVVQSTIQAAVDAARPGDTVLVPPGRYHETVTITKSQITIRGSHGAVLDAAGHTAGIRAASGPITQPPSGPPVCPPLSLHDLTIEGLRVENATLTGVLLRGVDGFSVRGGVYAANDQYAIFPICSQDGLIEINEVSGTDDAAIYVGDSRDVTIEGNHATASTVGIEVENSTQVVARANTTIGNTAGIAAFVLPGLPMAATEDVVIERNVILRNNRPNPVLPGEDDLGAVPTGSGILSVGADRVTIRDNRVAGNDSGGIAVLANPFATGDPRIDPLPDDDRVLANAALHNGLHPDPLRSPFPGADLIYDGTGRGTCFADNVFQTSFPGALESVFACGP
jgi:parallel beta-helix repeat protein